MLCLDLRQGSKNLRKVPAHGLGCGALILGIDRRHNGPMLIDQRQHGLWPREGELADTVHMGLDVLNRLPCQWATGTFCQGNVKQLVVSLKGGMIVPSRSLFLHLKKIVDPLSALPIEG